MPKKMLRLELSSEVLTQMFSDALGCDVRVIHVKYDSQYDGVQIVLDGIGRDVEEGCEIPLTSITIDDLEEIQAKLKEVLNESIVGALM